MEKPRCYFSGVLDKSEIGHYLYLKGGWSIARHNVPEDFPMSPHTLDGGLLSPRGGQPEGLAALWSTAGWTVIQFWDRSGDSRGNSCASFVIDREVGFVEAVEISKAAWPKIWERFTFDVVPS